MAYKVINEFIDKHDKTLYKVGEVFPKGNAKPTKKRIEELSKKHQKYKVSFIEEVQEEKKPSKQSKE